MRVFIAGIDGYLGWPLAIYLNARGHTVAGADLLLRRKWVAEVGGISALPIVEREERLVAFKEKAGSELDFRVGDLTDYQFVKSCFQDFQPEAVVHLGQMPSAPYSMMDQAHCVWTQQNNVVNNLNILWAIKEAAPAAHLIKLGTMGEYGTPAVDIPEGFFEVEFRGRKDRLPFRGRRAVGITRARCTIRTTHTSPRRFGAYGRPISCRASSSARASPRWAMICACAHG